MPDFDLRAADVERLGDQSYFIRDRFLPPDTCRVVRRSIEQMAREGDLRAGGVGRQPRTRRQSEIRGDYITWLDRTDGYPWDRVAERFEQLRMDLNRMGYLGLQEGDVQIARYPGDGSGFDRHLDVHRQLSDRRVTTTLYLNPDWEPADGGELRIYPPDAPEQPVEVPPLGGRLVTFLSEEVEHEVLPTHAPRYALSCWYRGRAPDRVKL